MPELTAPPLPSWHGTPPDLVQQYVEFVQRGSQNRMRSLIRDLRTDIENTQYRKEDYASYLRSYRDTIKSLRAELKKLSGFLVPLDDLSRYDEGLIGLLDHPALIGIRPDSGGRMVLHLRLRKGFVEGEPSVYLGDFEVSLAIRESEYDDRDYLPIAQTNQRSSEHRGHGFTLSHRQDGIAYGNLMLPTTTVRTHLVAGTLTSLVDSIGETITQNGTPWNADEDEPSAPTWSGIASDVEGMLARTIETSANAPTRKKILANEQSLASYERDAEGAAKTIRKAGLKLAKLRSELEDAERAFEANNFDEETARAQLRYITSLDGVMGVRFESFNREVVPVIHVRTSVVYQDERYDMGDYELTFAEYDSYDSSAAVVVVNQTRSPKRGGGFYYHPGGTYGRARRNWFCFGNRAHELRQLFRRGEFAEFAHMAVNSLCSVNGDDQYNIPYYFTPIPMDATWTPPVLAARPRRRRLARALAGVLA